MKKLLLALALLFSLNVSYSSFVPSKQATVSSNENAAKENQFQTTDVTEKPKINLSGLTAEEILSLTPSCFEKVAGKRMSFKDKLALVYMQRNIKRELRKNGTVNLKDYVGDDGNGFSIEGFALGFFLGFIGVALAYIITKDKVVRRSSWYGVLGAFVLGLIFVIALLGAATK